MNDPIGFWGALVLIMIILIYLEDFVGRVCGVADRLIDLFDEDTAWNRYKKLKNQLKK